MQELKAPAWTGRVELHAEAPLSFLAWLGWELRLVKPMVVYNFFPSEFHPLTGPAGQLSNKHLGRYEYLAEAEESTVGAEANKEAIVLIDPLSRSTKEQLASFVGVNGSAVDAGKRLQMTGPRGQILQQQDLVLILQDVIELLERLQYEGIKRFHLGLSCPDFLAFFLGQQLDAYSVYLYEYDQTNHVYRYVFPLADDGNQG